MSKCFIFNRIANLRNLHSFPTRRSSDLFARIEREHPGARLVRRESLPGGELGGAALAARLDPEAGAGDRKSTRLNSSHTVNSYADFCLKKKTVITKAKFLPRTRKYDY